MKIGVMIGADNPEGGLNDVIDLAKKAEELGLDSAVSYTHLTLPTICSV